MLHECVAEFWKLPVEATIVTWNVEKEKHNNSGQADVTVRIDGYGKSMALTFMSIQFFLNNGGILFYTQNHVIFRVLNIYMTFVDVL